MIFSSNPSENQELNKYAIWSGRTFPLSTIEKKKSLEKNQHPFIFLIITRTAPEDEVEITPEYLGQGRLETISIKGIAIDSIDIERPQSV